MIAESKNKLPIFGKSRGKTIFRYNFRQVEKNDPEDNIETVWQFEQVMVESPVTKSKLIQAVIEERFKLSDEIALINNLIETLIEQRVITIEGTEYSTYRDLRIQAKVLAGKI